MQAPHTTQQPDKRSPILVGHDVAVEPIGGTLADRFGCPVPTQVRQQVEWPELVNTNHYRSITRAWLSSATRDRIQLQNPVLLVFEQRIIRTLQRFDHLKRPALLAEQNPSLLKLWITSRTRSCDVNAMSAIWATDIRCADHNTICDLRHRTTDPGSRKMIDNNVLPSDGSGSRTNTRSATDSVCATQTIKWWTRHHQRCQSRHEPGLSGIRCNWSGSWTRHQSSAAGAVKR